MYFFCIFTGENKLTFFKGVFDDRLSQPKYAFNWDVQFIKFLLDCQIFYAEVLGRMSSHGKIFITSKLYGKHFTLKFLTLGVRKCFKKRMKNRDPVWSRD